MWKAAGRCGSFIGGGGCVNRGDLPRAPAMLCLRPMADQRALDAISRIERALARIERAAARPVAAEPAANSDEFDRLRAAHDTLRRTVAGAIGQIDHLLETGERR